MTSAVRTNPNKHRKLSLKVFAKCNGFLRSAIVKNRTNTALVRVEGVNGVGMGVALVGDGWDGWRDLIQTAVASLTD